jgi:hypothetical protein
MLDQLDGVGGSVPSYPSYNVCGTAKMPFASQSQSPDSHDADLSLEARENTLTIPGEKQATDEEKTGDVLIRANERTSERRFQLADYVVVKGAGKRAHWAQIYTTGWAHRLPWRLQLQVATVEPRTKRVNPDLVLPTALRLIRFSENLCSRKGRARLSARLIATRDQDALLH